MNNKSAITLDYLKETYPGYRPIKVHQFKRGNQLNWVSSIGRIELYRYANVKEQIKAVIAAGAEKVCIFLRDPVTEDVLIPDIDIEKFIKNN
jgi:hypothetical protein